MDERLLSGDDEVHGKKETVQTKMKRLFVCELNNFRLPDAIPHGKCHLISGGNGAAEW